MGSTSIYIQVVLSLNEDILDSLFLSPFSPTYLSYLLSVLALSYSILQFSINVGFFTFALLLFLLFSVRTLMIFFREKISVSFLLFSCSHIPLLFNNLLFLRFCRTYRFLPMSRFLWFLTLF